MYYESAKKTYYRFPSLNSVQNFDRRYYYPDQPYASGESLHFTSLYGDDYSPKGEYTQEGYEDPTDIY